MQTERSICTLCAECLVDISANIATRMRNARTNTLLKPLGMDKWQSISIEIIFWQMDRHINLLRISRHI